MATTYPAVDPLQFKVEARFSKKKSVVSVKRRSRWWEIGLANTEKWEDVRKIGEGGHGSVYLQRKQTSAHLRAVKMLQPDYLKKTCGLDFQRELHTLIAVREHPDLFVQFLGWYEDKPGGFVFFAMEYLRDGDLGEYLKDTGPLTDKAARGVTEQLLKGLKFLHGRDICHRDLKPQNVLISSKLPLCVKLADFGVSKHTTGSSISVRHGTTAYMAPELLGMIQARNEYTSAVDIWALGCMIYEMLTSESPFMDRSLKGKVSTLMSTISGIISTSGPVPTDMRLLLDFCNGNTGLPTEAIKKFGISGNAFHFITKLLVVDPKDRISAADALEYGWVLDFSAVLRSQLLSLDINAPSEDIEEFILRYTQHQPIDISVLLTPSKQKDANFLLFESVTKGYMTISVFLLDLCEQQMDGDFLRYVEYFRSEVKALDGIDEPTGRLQTILQAAAANGHIEIVKLLHRKGANINTPAAESRLVGPTQYVGRTALQAAAENGHLEVVRFLLEKGAYINAAPCMFHGRTALRAAAENGHSIVVRLLLESGAEVNAAPGRQYAQTALQAAAKNGHLTAMKLLFKSGAKTNTVHFGPTLLQTAVNNGYFEVVKLLLENGAEPNRGLSGPTELQSAARIGHLELVKLLLEHGAQVNAAPGMYHGRTTLQAAAENGHLELVKLLLEHGSQVNAVPAMYHRRTALQAAAENGHLEVLELLLGSRADVNAVAGECHGMTALEAAVCHYNKTAIQATPGYGDLRVLQLLLESGGGGGGLYSEQATLPAAVAYGKFGGQLPLRSKAEVNTKANLDLENLPGMIAVVSNEYLRVPESPSDSDVEANSAQTIRDLEELQDLAELRGLVEERALDSIDHHEVVNVLVKNGAEVDAFQKYVGGARLQATNKPMHTKIELQEGPEAGVGPTESESAEYNGQTILRAAENGELEVVRLLLRSGASTDVTKWRSYCRIALQVAAEKGHVQVVKLLLEDEAEVNTTPTECNSRTALQAAAENGQIEVVKLLLENGAGVSTLSDSGRALRAANENGHLEVVELLMENGFEFG